MISKTRLFIFACVILLLTVGLSDAKTYTLNPDSGNSNQNQINEALERGDVYLKAGVYEVDDTIIIGSNRVLTGDKDAIIRVSSSSSQWFVGLKGVISCEEVVQNVEISGFQIDGNIKDLPRSYANSRSDTSHDCEKLIILHGYSNQFAKNIKIHDLKLYNSYSDGIYILFGENVQVYNNFISNTQHEGVYLSCVKNGLFYSNKIAGITSDCGRLDNCVNVKVYNNLFFSYNGESYGAYKNGHCGLQIADAGASKGYDASNKPLKTTNIEVFNNTFADPGRKAIWLDSTGKGVTNVYIHDNEFIDAAGLETQGIPVGDISNDVSYENPPSVEMSENVFSSIFDFLNMKVYTQVGENDTVILPEGMKESSSKALGSIEYQTVGNNTTTFVKIHEKYLEGVSKVEYEVDGVKEIHTLMIGERTSNGVEFTKTSVWEGDLPHTKDALKLDGKVDADLITVKCISPTDSFTPVMEITTIDFNPIKINPGIYVLLGIIIFGIILIRFILRHMA